MKCMSSTSRHAILFSLLSSLFTLHSFSFSFFLFILSLSIFLFTLSLSLSLSFSSFFLFLSFFLSLSSVWLTSWLLESESTQSPLVPRTIVDHNLSFFCFFFIFLSGSLTTRCIDGCSIHPSHDPLLLFYHTPPGVAEPILSAGHANQFCHVQQAREAARTQIPNLNPRREKERERRDEEHTTM